uniref:DUF4129 domain-containing protein n=1 Tax=Tahibacter caeni TaxID=1453545 RepID=UPI0021492430
MRLEGLTVALRPRSSWEATDLGIALTRRHARTVWSAWTLATLPVVVLVNAACAAIDAVWLATLLVWWLKPVFDRVPLYVLSRAVFGATPGVRETLRAALRWGWRPMLGWLTWRRLHPSRSLLLPVDLLEGLRGSRRGERVRVLQRSTSGTAMLVTLIAVNMEMMLSLSVVLLILMFVPIEFFSDAAQQVWSTLFENPPLWGQCLVNLIGWLALSLIEPFYVGAGFGLYLNRRTQLEAWDVELAFRRLAARLSTTAAALLPLLFGALLLAGGARAAEDEPVDAVGGAAGETAAADAGDAPKDSLRRIFAGRYVDDGGFGDSVRQGYADPDLSPRSTEHVWEKRDKSASTSDLDLSASPLRRWFEAAGRVSSFAAENVLWVLVAIFVFLLVRYHRVWLPWIGDRFVRERKPDALEVRDIATPEDLPADVAGAVRALWQQGQARAALALFYRAAVLGLDE